MPTIGFDNWYRGLSLAVASASSSLDFGRAYRGSSRIPIVAPAFRLVEALDDRWGFGSRVSASASLRIADAFGSGEGFGSGSILSGLEGVAWATSSGRTAIAAPSAGFDFGRSYRGRFPAVPAAGPSGSFGRSYRGSFRVAAISAPQGSPIVFVHATDSVGFADGGKRKAAAGVSTLFDAFTGVSGTLLENHPPTGGVGSWAVHPLYNISQLRLESPGRLARGTNFPSAAIYIASESVQDGRIGWTTADNDVTYAQDLIAGCGLRISPTEDAGYYGVMRNDGGPTWAILKRVAGVETILASSAKPALVLAPTSMELEAQGSSLTLRVDGSPVAVATDSSLAGPGRYGVYFRPTASPDSTGPWIDDVSFAIAGEDAPVGLARIVAGVGTLDAAGLGEARSILAAAGSLDGLRVDDGRRADSGGLDLFDDFDAAGSAETIALEDHAPAGGGTWARHPSYPDGGGVLALDSATVVRSAIPDPILYIADAAAVDARAEWRMGDDGATGEADAFAGIGLRVSPTQDTGYFAGSLNEGGSTWAIVKRIAGVETVLATGVKPALVLPSASLSFEARGSTLTLKVDGSVAAVATDASIAGPGRMALAYRFHPTPQDSGTWLDSISLGPPGASSRDGPEQVAADIRAKDDARLAERTWIVATSAVIINALDRAWGLGEGRSLAAGATSRDAAWESPIASVRSVLAASDGIAWASHGFALVGVFGSESWAVPDRESTAYGSVLVTSLDAAGQWDSREIGAGLGSGDGWGGLDGRGLVLAGVVSLDSVALQESGWVRVILATLFYTIYGNDGAGGPIDYGTPLATTTTQAWETDPLDAPGRHLFGVRVTSSVTGIEEQNIDATVEIVLDDADADVTTRPAPVFSLRAFPIPGGGIRVEWKHPNVRGPRRPAGFRVYVGSPTPNYGTPVATISAGSSLAGTYRTVLADQPGGVELAVAVRAFNATAEEPGRAFVLTTPDADPPDAVDELTGAATNEEGS